MTLDELERFDWVKARVECNPERLFAELRSVVNNDCTSAREQSKKRSSLVGIVFENGKAHRSFAVSRETSESRIFQLEGDHITVTNLRGDPLYATTALLFENQCFLECEGKLYKPWQFSMKVLEEFFFNPPTHSA